MKNKKIVCLVCALVCSLMIFTGCDGNSGTAQNPVEQPNVTSTNGATKKSNSKLNPERIMADGTYQIRFSDLVSLKSLEEYKDKTVSAIGYLSPIMGYDGGFSYLMNLPYQTCPYCLPGDTQITNTLAIYAKEGEQIDFTEAAVVVKGTLKLEPHVDEYGYEYNYRLIDVEIEKADTSTLGQKIELYNRLAEKEILTRLMEALYSVDDNVFYDVYVSNGANYQRYTIDESVLDSVIADLNEFDPNEVSVLIEVATELKELAGNVNKLIEARQYSLIASYQGKVENLWSRIGYWMSIYEL